MSIEIEQIFAVDMKYTYKYNTHNRLELVESKTVY